MDKETIIAELKGMLTDFLKAGQVELVDLACNYQGKGLVVRILVDYPESGISIGECAALNREIGLLLEEKNTIAQDYILEVSSPGIDRPLITASDFRRSLNRKARVFLKEQWDGIWELEGIISRVEGDSVYIAGKEGKITELPLLKIRSAEQVLE